MSAEDVDGVRSESEVQSSRRKDALRIGTQETSTRAVRACNLWSLKAEILFLILTQAEEFLLFERVHEEAFTGRQITDIKEPRRI